MTLLEFSRNIALEWSVYIMVLGIIWRIFGVIFLGYKANYAKARNNNLVVTGGAVGTVFTRMLPKPNFWSRIQPSVLLAYTFHIGLAIIVFGYDQHILYIKDLTGLSWPALPEGIINLVGIITMGALIALLVRRISNKVLRKISGLDDYFSWFVTMAPVATGILAQEHLLGPYENMLALHFLSVALLFVWLPFGKLAHAFFFVLSRATTGAIFTRRGART